MSANQILRPGRLIVAAGYFTLLGVFWHGLAAHWHGVAEAESTPLRAAPRDSRGSEELHLLGLLHLESLLPSLKDLSKQKDFIEALPENWALPKFSPSSAVELLELQKWLSKVKEQVNANALRNTAGPFSASSLKSEPLVMQELLDAVLEPSWGVASAAGGADLLSGADVHNDLPSLLKEITASLPRQSFLAPVDILRHGSGVSEAFLRKVQLLQRLPSLDRLDIGKIVEIFAYPSDIEWPVKRRRLALLLPIVTSAEDGGLLSSPRTTLVERSGLAGITLETEKMLLPLAQPDGQLLFAKLKEIFPQMTLPQTLTLLPMATLKHTTLSTVDALWSALKSTLLPRQAIMAADESSTLIGPVLDLTNLAKLNLVSSESLRKQFLSYLLPSPEAMGKNQPTAANIEDDSGSKELLKAFADALESGFPLEDTVKNVFTESSTKLQQALLPFEGVFALDGTLPASRLKSLDKWKEEWDRTSTTEFRNDLFFRLQVPVVALSRESIAHAFRRLQRLPAPCDDSAGEHGTCALGLAAAPSATQEELERDVQTLSRRVEVLAEQLRRLVHELRGKVSELTATTGAATGIEENRAFAKRHISLTETDAASGQKMSSASPLRESSSTSPPSRSDTKEPEGVPGGRLFDFPNTFSHAGRHSRINNSTLQQALDASVQLCDTLTVALRYTKNEVRSLQLFNTHAGSIGRNAGQSPKPARHTHLNGFENWESPDHEFQLVPLTSEVEDNDSRNLPFLANINGQALVALPRNILQGLVLEAGEAEASIPAIDLPIGPREPQLQRDEDTMFENNRKNYNAFRRLQATQENGALATKQLVLVDPLTLGKLLFARVNDTTLMEGLKKGIASASKVATRLDPALNDNHGATSDVSFSPLLKDLLVSNALSFPAFTLPAAELLRVGIFPQRLLHTPVEEWVSPSVRVPPEAGKYALPELLQLHSLASQLKKLSLEELLLGKTPAALEALGLNNDELRHKIGDIHLKSLIPSQLADLPLQELSTCPGGKVFGTNDLPEGSCALSLEKLLALDDVFSALLSQPFGDVLGLKKVLDGLTLEQFRLSPALPRGELSDNNSRLLKQSLPNAAVAKWAETNLAFLTSREGPEQSSGKKSSLDFLQEKWLAPRSSPLGTDNVQLGPTSSSSNDPAGGAFLPGKHFPESTQNRQTPKLGSLAEELRNHRSMADIFRHLLSVVGVTIAKEFYF